MQAVVQLVDEPWDAAVIPPGNNPAFRMTSFGSGNGLLSFHADDRSDTLRIFDITWLGSPPRKTAADSNAEEHRICVHP